MYTDGSNRNGNRKTSKPEIETDIFHLDFKPRFVQNFCSYSTEKVVNLFYLN